MPATKTSDESAAATLTGTELIRVVQSALNVKLTVNQILDFIAAAKTFTDPTILGALTLGGGSPFALDLPNAGASEITASGGADVNIAPTLRFNGGFKDSAGALGAAGDVFMSNGTKGVWRGRQPMVFPYVTSATSHTASSTAGFFETSGNRRQTKIDLTNFTQARIVASMGSTAPVADTQIYVRYYTATSTTFADWLPMGPASADVTVLLPNAANACTAGAWTDLVAGAKADVFIVCGCVAPSGSTGIAATSITIQFR